MKKITVVVLLACSLVFAERPFSVEDSGVVEKGFETEIAYTGETKGDSTINGTGIVLNGAFLPNTQLGYEYTFIHTPYEKWGQGDPVITFKQNLGNDQALKLSYKTIWGDEKNGFGNEFKQYAITFAKDLTYGNSTIFTNFGYTTYDKVAIVNDEAEDEEVQNLWFIGLGLKLPLTETISFCSEATKLVAIGEYLDSDDNCINGMIGLKWEPIDGQAYDISYRSILESKEYMYALGTTIAL